MSEPTTAGYDAPYANDYESPDYDWVVVGRLVKGVKMPTASREERRRAALVLLDHDYSWNAAAEQVGVNLKSVERWAGGGYARVPAKCGTTQGYRRHYTVGEKPCAECRAAYNAAQRKKTRRKKARAINDSKVAQ